MSGKSEYTGKAVAVLGDDIDTDRIIPARYLKEITFSRMGFYPFIDDMKADASHPFHKFKGLDRNRKPHFLFVNVNFGSGSSREHAPQALWRWGIDAVVGESFAEIFAGNCVMLGIPAVIASKSDIAKIQSICASEDREWKLDLEKMELYSAGHKFVANPNPNVEAPELGTTTPQSIGTLVPAEEIRIRVTMQDSRRDALLKGTWDGTGLLIANADKVAANAQKLAYMNGYK